MNITQRTHEREDAINSMAHAFEAAENSAKADFEQYLDGVIEFHDDAHDALDDALRWAQQEANSTFMNTASGQHGPSGFVDQIRARTFVGICRDMDLGIRRKKIIEKIKAQKEAA